MKGLRWQGERIREEVGGSKEGQNVQKDFGGACVLRKRLVHLEDPINSVLNVPKMI